MARTWIGLGALAAIALASTPAGAQVRDAAYRGTLVCDKLPFTTARMREAIEVNIARGAVRYTHVVRLREAPEPVMERGAGTLESGNAMTLQGSWESGGRQYKASYSGKLVRRSFNLKGTQTWTVDGKTISRACSGAIKRPFRVFLPRQGRPPN